MQAIRFQITTILLMLCLAITALVVLGCEGMSKTSMTIQQTDPITSEPVNTDISAQYQGKTVYFSSEQSRDEFLEDPGQYVNKLPQFRSAPEEKTGVPRNISGYGYGY
jgi:YHS domain-containing protein